MIRTNSLPTNLPTTIGNSNKTILVDLSDVRKQLDFASTSSKQNTNSQKTVLREENITTDKRKSTNNIKIELEEEINKCFLQEIPRDLGVIKKDNRKICEFCKKKLKDRKSNQKPSQTRYWCGFHKVPVCFLICYDSHLTEIRSLYALKRRKL